MVLAGAVASRRRGDVVCTSASAGRCAARQRPAGAGGVGRTAAARPLRRGAAADLPVPARRAGPRGPGRDGPGTRRRACERRGAGSVRRGDPERPPAQSAGRRAHAGAAELCAGARRRADLRGGREHLRRGRLLRHAAGEGAAGGVQVRGEAQGPGAGAVPGPLLQHEGPADRARQGRCARRAGPAGRAALLRRDRLRLAAARRRAARATCAASGARRT